MTSLDTLEGLFTPLPDVVPTPRKCRRHQWEWTEWMDDSRVLTMVEWCKRCHRLKDAAASRRGRQSRNYGNRAELAVARKYGGQKIGHAGGPVDVRGAEFNVQVKTHRRLPPAEWRKAFGAMSANRERIPRLLLRFLPGAGLPPDDYFVMRADDWLRWFGKDEATQGGTVPE